MNRKTYSEAMSFRSFRERFEYLKLPGVVSESTFGGHRSLNQTLYHSYEWKKVRRKIILRDQGCDLAFDGIPIMGQILIHHITPITINDILNRSPLVFDLENLISVAFRTHNALHYGCYEMIDCEMVERRKNDTCPWR